jgi:hypothetical protein
VQAFEQATVSWRTWNRDDNAESQSQLMSYLKKMCIIFQPRVEEEFSLLKLQAVLLLNMPKSSAHRSLLDWNDDDPEAHKVSSPRSVRAMKAAGVVSSDLMMKSLEDFEEPGVLPDIIKIRFDHFKARRQEILRDVMRHYQATSQAPIAKENSACDSSALAMQQSEGAEKLRQVLEQEQRATEMLKNRQKQVRAAHMLKFCQFFPNLIDAGNRADVGIRA